MLCPAHNQRPLECRSVAVGLALGALLVRLLQPPAWFRHHTIAATGLGNVGNLPLVLVVALVHEAQGTLSVADGATEDLAIACEWGPLAVAALDHWVPWHWLH